MIDSEITNTVEVEEKEEKISVVDSLFQKLQTQFNDSQSIMKTLQSNVKIFYKEVLKERKELEKKIAKNKKKNKRKKSMSGLAFPSHISKELATFLGIKDENEKISRTEVTSRLIKYIKDNQLQNEENKKIIIVDEKLQNLFGAHLKEEDVLQFFNLQTYLKHHFIPTKKD